MCRFNNFLLFLLLLPIFLFANQNQQVRTLLSKADHTFFIENKGQWPKEVLFLAKTGGMNAWITKSGVVYDFYKLEKRTTTRSKKPFDRFDVSETHRYGYMVKAVLVNTKAHSIIEPLEKLQTYYNYFIGNDPLKWASHVPLYKEVKIQEIYDGIDIKYYFDNGLLRYDYIVKPNADPNQIKIKLEGVDGYEVNEWGELILHTHLGIVKQGKLLTYQFDKKIYVGSRFIKNADGTLGIKLTKYNKSQILIIDPLVYSTFIGGGSNDIGNSIALGSENNTYITGETSSSNFPTTSGAYDESLNGNDVFVSKLNADGSNLLYSTFIGGGSNDYAYSLALDSEDNAYITGNTESSDFPTTNGAYDQSQNGANDVFVCKLNADGSNLIYSTFIGGSSWDYGYSLKLDGENNVYITGDSESSDFPTTSSAYEQSLNGASDVIVCKLNAAGSDLIYSTFIGGSTWEHGNAIALNDENNAFITGYTYSGDFPTTNGAFDDSYNGGGPDVFICQLDSAGSNILFSTFIGGSNYDYCYTLALDHENNAYITGFTESSDFPTTIDAYDEGFNGDNDVFVCKLNNDGSNLLYSTFIGSSNNDYSYSIALDSNNNAYITGFTASNDFPTTIDAYDQSQNGDDDVFVCKLNADGSNLIYSTFIGGTSSDGGNSLTLDSENNTYITGETSSSNFPTTSGAYDESQNSGKDAFIVKININDNNSFVDQSIKIPKSFALKQNYPNPFNPVTTIEYALPELSEVHLSIYNLLGQKKEEIVHQKQSAGYYKYLFNATNYPNGIYFYFLTAHGLQSNKQFRMVKKMIVLK